MVPGSPHPEPARGPRAGAKFRAVTLTLLALSVIFLIVAFVAGWLNALLAKVGIGLVASLAVGIVVALSLVSFNAGRRREHRASTAATLTGGAVITALCIGATAAFLDHSANSAIVLGIPLTVVIIGCGAYAARRARQTVFGIPAAGYLAAALLAVPLTGGWIWYVFAGPGYFAEFNHIKARLADIPGVQLVEMGGNRDLTYEDIWARLRVEGKGDIMLMALTAASLSDSPDLHISKIGPFSFRNERWGYGAVIDREGKPMWHQSIGFTLNVGRRGDFSPSGRLSGRLQGRIRNVRELIQRYDDLVAVVRSLKEEKLFFRDDDGSTMEYLIRSSSGRDGQAR